MENIFLLSFAISIIYIIIIFLELKYFSNNNDETNLNKNTKQIIKEGLIVYLSSIFGFYIINQFNPEVEKIINPASHTLVFTDNPPF